MYLDIATAGAGVALPPAPRAGGPACAVTVVEAHAALAGVSAAERVGAVGSLALDFTFAALAAVVVTYRTAAAFVAVIIAIVATAWGRKTCALRVSVPSFTVLLSASALGGVCVMFR